MDPCCRKSIQKLQDLPNVIPVLCNPNFDLPFLAQRDALDIALGAVLSQESDSEYHPIVHISCKLNHTEKCFILNQ